MASTRRDNGKKRAVQFPKGSLKRAQEERGVTNQQVATHVRTSMSSWSRWKRTGLVPILAAPLVAAYLKLPLPKQAATADIPPMAWKINETLKDLGARVERIEKTLDLKAPGAPRRG